MQHEQRCLIAICTYNRVEKLRELLDSIVRNCEGNNYRVAVVENDDSRSAEAVARSFSATYEAEPVPGISAARNRCLGLLTAGDDFIIFVDDDEVVSAGWLDELTRVQREFGAHVVAGPVLTVFPADTPRWIIKGGFMQRKRFPTGHELSSVAAGNTLISAKAIRRSGLEFDASFSFTGGEDTDYFRRMRPFTGPPIWADGAVALEEATRDRLNLAWQARRAFRNGSVSARIQLRTKSKISVLAHSVGSIGLNSARFIIESVRLQAPSANSFNTVVANAGCIAEVLHFRVPDEYSR